MNALTGGSNTFVGGGEGDVLVDGREHHIGCGELLSEMGKIDADSIPPHQHGAAHRCGHRF